jgi:hypothetical protein
MDFDKEKVEEVDLFYLVEKNDRNELTDILKESRWTNSP